MTRLGIHYEHGDDIAADKMLKEARVALALLQRYAPAMSHTDEGRVYLSIIHDTCVHGGEWALAHVTLPAYPLTAGSAPAVERPTMPAVAPAGAHLSVGPEPGVLTARSAPAASTNDARPNLQGGSNE